MASVFVLSGVVDLGTREANLGAAQEFWATATGPVWVVDLGDVSFMDSTGLGLLVEMRSHAVARAATVMIRNASPRVLQLLHITGLSQLFTLDPPVGPPGRIEIPGAAPHGETDVR